MWILWYLAHQPSAMRGFCSFTLGVPAGEKLIYIAVNGSVAYTASPISVVLFIHIPSRMVSETNRFPSRTAGWSKPSWLKAVDERCDSEQTTVSEIIRPAPRMTTPRKGLVFPASKLSSIVSYRTSQAYRFMRARSINECGGTASFSIT
jgi:hypothetical protein